MAASASRARLCPVQSCSAAACGSRQVGAGHPVAEDGRVLGRERGLQRGHAPGRGSHGRRPTRPAPPRAWRDRPRCSRTAARARAARCKLPHQVRGRCALRRAQLGDVTRRRGPAMGPAMGRALARRSAPARTALPGAATSLACSGARCCPCWAEQPSGPLPGRRPRVSVHRDLVQRDQVCSAAMTASSVITSGDRGWAVRPADRARRTPLRSGSLWRRAAGAGSSPRRAACGASAGGRAHRQATTEKRSPRGRPVLSA